MKSTFFLKNKQRFWCFTDWSIVTASGLHHFAAGVFSYFFPLFLVVEKKGEKWNGSTNTKTLAAVQRNLADAAFSRLLSIFLGLRCGTRESNEERRLPHDKLLHLSNLEYHQISCQWPFQPVTALLILIFAPPAVFTVSCCCTYIWISQFSLILNSVMIYIHNWLQFEPVSQGSWTLLL